MCGAREQAVVMRRDWGWRVKAQTYLFPLTTSSFASCRQMLLRVPKYTINFLAALFSHQSRAYHDCGCWKKDVVVDAIIFWCLSKSISTVVLKRL